jgi:DNA repair exonuclease SbcCD ATPase subunit
MIKRILLTLLISAAGAAQLNAQLFGHSSKKVNALRTALEQIKIKYDNALIQIANLELALAGAIKDVNTHEQRINVLSSELLVSRTEAEQLKSMDENRMQDFEKHVSRLLEATKRLEDLERAIDEMSELPSQIFGNQDK